MIKILTLFGKFNAIDSKKIPKEQIVAVIDPVSLRRFLTAKVANELQFLSEDCYYPKVADIYKELLVRCQTDEKKVNEYAKNKYSKITSKWKLANPKIIYDPQTILVIAILQEFLFNKDYTGALAAINLMSLRFYSNSMYKFIKYCNADYFRTTMNRLSHNHLYSQKKTIGNTILYLAQEVLKKYKTPLERDDTEKIILMLYEHRSRINQSVRSFANKYYEISKDKDVTRIEREDLPEKQTLDKKIRETANKISKEISIYGLVDNEALDIAQKITKQNGKLAREYIQSLPNTKYVEPLDLAIYFFLKEVEESGANTKLDYIEASKRLMSIKITTKPIYYKKIVIGIHDQIIKDLGYMKYFDRLSIQSRGISRRFLSLYLAILIYNYLKS